MTYKAIGFDWGGVLNGRPGKYFGMGLAELLDITEEQFKDAYFAHNKEFNQGLITLEELWIRVLADAGRTDRLEDTLRYVGNSSYDSPNEDVIALVDSLRSHGYKTALLSNNTVAKGEQLRTEGFDRHFDVFHISAETGIAKPEPQAFINLANDLEVEPSEMIFIDDTPKSLASSNEVGFTPVLFEDYEQLVAELQKLGVKISLTRNQK